MRSNLKTVKSQKNSPKAMPTAPIFAILLLQLINVGRPQDVIPFLKQLRPGVISIGLVLITSLVYWNSVSGKNIFKSPEVRRFVNIVLLMILLLPLSHILPKSLYFLKDFWPSILFFLAFTHFIRDIKHVKISILILILSSFILSISMFGTSGSGRTSIGTMYDPNDIALLFVSILPLTIFQSFYSKGITRYISLATIVFSVLAIIGTQSRGAMTSLLVMGVVWLIINQKEKGFGLVKKFLIIIFCASLFAFLAPQSFWDRMGTTVEGGETAGSGRITVWQRASQMMVWYPLGVGIGNFSSVYGRHLSAGRFEETGDIARNRAWMTAHNSYLLIGVELGFVGLFLYLYWLFGMLSRLLKNGKNTNDIETSRCCFMLFFSLLGFMVPAFFLSQTFAPLLLTIAGNSACILRIAASQTK